MWLVAAKALLVIFLVVAVGALTIRGMRRSRANRGNPQWSQPHQGQPDHIASLRGVMPKTPLPNRGEGEVDPPPTRDGERVPDGHGAD
ncbi:MAG: hypothetical protein NVS4B6_21110 [Mycobacterium sp.]